MDASDESSSHGESQASQLLRAVLPHGISSPLRSALRSDAEHTQGGVSEAPSSPSIKPGLPHYHFHGLIATQIDSQAEDYAEGGGSLKENAPTAWDRERASPSSAPYSSPGNPGKLSSDHRDTDCIEASYSTKDVTPHVSEIRSVTPILRPAKAVSFVSPVRSPRPVPLRHSGTARTSAAPARAVPRGQRQRSSSPASQDSFAGPFSFQDPQKLFLENTKTFNVPLSELGRPQSNLEDDSSAQMSSPSRPPSMYSLSPQHRRVAPPTPARPLARTGEILVAATPSDSSHSGNSQGGPLSQSQNHSTRHPDGDTQLSDQYPRGQGQTVEYDYGEDRPAANVGTTTLPSSPPDDASTEPSSSYERLLNMDPFEPNPEPYVATQLATQPSDAEPTQPADVTQDVDPSTSLANQNQHSNYTTRIDRQYPAASTSGPSEGTSRLTVPKSMLSMIPPHKRWKYQGVDSPSTRRDGAGQAGPSNETDSPVIARYVQDTQPSDTYAVDGSAVTPVPLPPLRRQLPTRARAPVASEIVPGSEPMEPDNTILPDRANRLPQVARSPGQFTMQHAQPSGRAELPSDDIVPDSVVYGAGETSGEEEEIPLAAAIPLNSRDKGKGKALSKPESKTLPAVQSRNGGDAKRGPQGMVTPGSSAVKGGRGQTVAKLTTRQPIRGRSPEINEVPSSEPLENVTKHATPGGVGSRGSKIRQTDVKPARRGSKASSKSRSSTPIVPKKMRRAVPMVSSDDETAVSPEVDATIPDVDGEAGTELADDDYMDVDEEQILPRPTSSRKRKRAISTMSKRSVSKVPTRTSKASSSTPLVRSGKKLKTSSVMSGGDAQATRVYALWKQDGHYYPGTVHSLVSTSPMRYRIHFDDSTEDIVDISKLRLCRLNNGDHVLLLPDNEKAVVIDNARLETDRVVTVEFDSGDELERVEIEVKYMRIASRTLISAWKDRILTSEEIIPIVKPKPLQGSPSPSKITLGSAGSVKGLRRLLAKTGLVVTLSPGNKNWVQDKDRLMAAIKSHGGTVIDDWMDIFTMEGTHSQNNKRWVIQKEDVQWNPRDDVERIFLLSDDANQKPKFLMSLGLGIPCLSIDWLLQTVDAKAEKDWWQFLLPAGFSDRLNARVSQLVDLDWGNSTEYLNGIMSNLVASKLFNDKSILCVAPEFVPVPTKVSRRNTDLDKARESSRMVPRIILSMGASRVEAVPDVKYASTEDLSKFDYVVVKEYSDIDRMPQDVNCVHFGWVKDCLIAGRLLRLADY